MTDPFEERLGGLLGDLGRQAPRGPSHGQVRARLVRRAARRWAAGAGLVLFCGLVAGWLLQSAVEPAVRAPARLEVAAPPVPAMPAPPAVPQPSPQSAPEAPRVWKPRVGALALQADHLETRDALEKFFAACGADRAVIIKESGELSFSMSIPNGQPLAQVRADLESLLANYDRAEISLRNGRLSYSLLASGRP